MKDRLLEVCVADKKVGELRQVDDQYLFKYTDVESLNPQRDLVSLTMPVRHKDYDAQILMPAFQLALPEGALLELIRKRFAKVMDVWNDLNIIRMVGQNTIGRITFIDPHSANHKEPVGLLDVEDIDSILNYPEGKQLFLEMLEAYGVFSGVSGIQPKMLWQQVGGKIAIPTKNYILKAASPEYPGLCVNEYFCLQVARRSGLETSNAYLSHEGEILGVERFDVVDNRRLAFEEMCALKHYPNHGKYEGSYEEIAEIIRKIPVCATTQALASYFKMVAVSVMLKNGDAHLKNFGILYDDISSVRLAPAYDIVTTTVYLLNDLPALTLGGKKQWPRIKELCHFGENYCQLKAREANQIVDEVRQAISKTVDDVKEYGKSNPEYQKLCEKMAAEWLHPNIS